MRKAIFTRFTFALIIAICCCAIGNAENQHAKRNNSNVAAAEAAEAAETPKYESIVAERTIYYDGNFDKKKSFIVVSKLDLCLSVYADVNGDTLLIARYPVCLSLNKGHKQKSGDKRTPECTLEQPFTITSIEPADSWTHDFHDGRGEIKAYGNWFLRLKTGFQGIGIHGSTNNEASIPGRASEGCIRLYDADIDHLKANYAYVGMPVIVKAEDQGNLPFEKK